MIDIKESDWKIFRKLREPALERYCQRVLNDIALTVEKDDYSYHERYLELWKLMRDRDETIAIAFNDPRRSRAILQLVNIIAEDLLTDAELDQFSQETRARVEGIKSLRDS